MKVRSLGESFDRRLRPHCLMRMCALWIALAGSLWTTGCGGDANQSPARDMMALPPGVQPYPPVPPQVQKLSGTILATPHVIPFFFPGDTLQNQLSTFVQAYVTASTSWQVLKEYGIGPGTVAPPVVATQMPAATMTDPDIQAFIVARVSDGTITPDAQSIVVLYLPQSTTVTRKPEVSCTDFFGYHGIASMPTGGTVVYAVIPRCAMELFTDLTSTTSHELAEAATDPSLSSYNDLNDPYGLWRPALGGAEIGDLCNNLTDSNYMEAGVGMVARVWSNAAMAAFTNPCVPNVPAPSFFGIPLHTQLQRLKIGDASRSIEQIPVRIGKSATIAVRMFSPTKPSPTWVVRPVEFPLAQASGMSPPVLYFSWQESTEQQASGQDGQTLHLTITAGQGASPGYTSILLVSTGPTVSGGKTDTYWVALVQLTQ